MVFELDPRGHLPILLRPYLKLRWILNLVYSKKTRFLTDIAVHEPAICGATDGATYTNQTMLFGACQQRCRRCICLSAKFKLDTLEAKQPDRPTPGPRLVVTLVLTQTTSSHLLYPHFANTSRPLSSPSPAPLPTHMNTKLGSAANAGIGSACNSSHPKEEEKGGSRRITSNFVGWRVERAEMGR